jgi:predicted DCC family thiol-disulfide oxidoreductase YuxK
VGVPVVRFTVAGQPDDAPAPALFTGREYVVVYDGHCRICGRLAGVLKTWDARGTFDVVPSQAPGVQARFPWIPARAYRESLQLVHRSGRTLQGAAAVERMLDLLPRGRWISWVFSLPFARPLAERLYRWFARNRYRLGCGEHCRYRRENVDFHDGASSAS